MNRLDWGLDNWPKVPRDKVVPISHVDDLERDAVPGWICVAEGEHGKFPEDLDPYQLAADAGRVAELQGEDYGAASVKRFREVCAQYGAAINEDRRKETADLIMRQVRASKDVCEDPAVIKWQLNDEVFDSLLADYLT